MGKPNLDVLSKCNCKGCEETIKKSDVMDLPYRYNSPLKHTIISISGWMIFPVASFLLVGYSQWLIVILIGFLGGYLLNAFLLCSSCTYHHDDVKICGCVSKSIFPFKRKKSWGRFENIFGWSAISILNFAPTYFVLIMRKEIQSIVIISLVIIINFFFLYTFSCPNCRQRGVCYLGQASMLLGKSQGKGV